MTDATLTTTASRLPAHPLSGVTWDRAIEAYLQTLLSPGTRREYGRHLRGAAASIGKPSLGDLTGEDLVYHGARMRGTGREVAPSRVLALIALRSFLLWARARQAVYLHRDDIHDALKLPKKRGRIPYEILSRDEQASMIAACRSTRDRAIVAVLLGTGLRCQELVDLDVSTIREINGKGRVEVRNGKGGRRRVVPMSLHVLRLIREYLQETGRTTTSTGPLFLAQDRAAGSRTPSRLSTAALRLLISKLVDQAGIVGKKISVHSMRHTFAVQWLRQHPGQIEKLRRLLGHVSITTTMGYADHIEDEELEDMHLEVPGVDYAAA